MMAFISAPENMVFMVALALMLMIGLFEGITTLLGAGLSSVLDSLLPDVDIHGPEFDTDSGMMSSLLGWLHVGRVPMLVILIVWLTAFGLLGLLLQGTMMQLSGALMSPWLIAVPAFLLAVPVVRVSGHAIMRFMPNDETEAVSQESFIGLVATITLGEARCGHPAEARLRDHFGQTHYVMLQPDQEGLAFKQGEEVLIVARQDSLFLAIGSHN
jgi:hypothetical protein